MNNFDGKVVIITGGGGGIGRATALRLAQDNAKITLVDIKEQGMEETKQMMLDVNKNVEVLIVAADVSQESRVEDYVKQTKDRFGRIDAFFNNAGVEAPNMPMDEYDTDTYNKVVAINQSGVFYGLKHVLKVMKEQKSGYIVNTASIAGIRAVPTATPYMASKHAVVGLTKEAAFEYGQYGISVNAIAPGVVLTPMVEAGFKDSSGDQWEEAIAAFVSMNPKKRMGKVEEIAEVAAFLLSGSADYLNGILIPVDGGQSNAY